MPGPAKKKPGDGGKAAAGKTGPKASPPAPKKNPAAKSKKPRPKKPPKAAAEPASPNAQIVQIQALAGAAMLVFAFAGIVGLGAWLYGKSGGGTLWWTVHALVRSVYAALIAVFLWNLIRRWRQVSFVLVLGCMVTAAFAFHGAEALRLNEEKIIANRVLGAVREGRRPAGGLTAEERENPYVDAYVVTRNMYRELDERAEARMAEYSSAHERATRDGYFLAPGRLGAESDVRESLSQLRDLDERLVRLGEMPVDVSGMLWSLDLLRVDPVTLYAYRKDLRETLAAINRAQDDAIARERGSIARTRSSLEVLLEAAGRYRIDEGRIVFDDPVDAVRFMGKTAKAGNEPGQSDSPASQ